MINKQKVLAIIPARGGSKRLPKKNMLDFGGKPLIAWSIEAAKRSKYVDEILVSTDNHEIARIAIENGAMVPELRPSFLAADCSSTESVLLYSIEKHGEDSEIIVLLQPTSPLRSEIHIDEAIELFSTENAKNVVSVTQCEHPPEWSGFVTPNGKMNDFFMDKTTGSDSQTGQVRYRLNGALYILDCKNFVENKKIIYDEYTYAYIMGNEYSIDIDTKLDFNIAQSLIQFKNNNEH